MAENPLKLIRKELAEFLPSLRAIKAFEEIFNIIPSTTTDLSEFVSLNELQAGSATSLAQEALSRLEQIADALSMIALKVTEEEDKDNLNIDPPIDLGDMAYQLADEVDIRGGAVTANLTNNQTILLTSNQALTDGAGASVGTLTNAPSVGDPTKWVSIDDNGTTRYIPAW